MTIYVSISELLVTLTKPTNQLNDVIKMSNFFLVYEPFDTGRRRESYKCPVHQKHSSVST
jgi:hypothetical protein